MNEKEYKKLLAEIDKENKRINDQFTTDDQRKWSQKKVDELYKKKADHESKNGINSENTQKPESGNTQNTDVPANTPANTPASALGNKPASTPASTPASKPKTYMEEQFEKSRQNGLNMSAAYAPNLGSTESASMKENPDFLALENKRDEAKMKDGSNLSNRAVVGEIENDIKNLSDDKFRELTSQAPLNEDDHESLQAEADINKAVGDTKGSGKQTTPENVIDNLSKEYGISTNFTPDGKIVPTEESQWKRADMAGKLAMFGTALSCIVSAMSGGNIPPINFNKIVGVDKQYTTYLANVHQYNEAIQAGVKKAAENKADADYAGFLNNLSPEKRKIFQDVSSEFEFTKAMADKERLEKQGEVSIDILRAQASAEYDALTKLHHYVKEGKITKEDFDNFLKYTRASMGKWSGWAERYLPDSVSVNAGPVDASTSKDW